MASPLGRLGVKTVAGGLAGLDFVPAATGVRAPIDPLAREVCAQLGRYFSGALLDFDLPLYLRGTDFQKRVWRALRHIASGTVLTYGDLAQKLGSGARAVGSACRANPLPIVVPCHRVVAKSGLGGYMGSTSGRRMQIKTWLLEHER